MGNASIEITKGAPLAVGAPRILKKLLQGSTYSSIIVNLWCGLGDSNSWPLPWQGSALTTELYPHVVHDLL